MSASNFGEALRRLLLHEGGYGNHPSDPGGPTNFGITIHDYRKYVRPGATAADVKAMTRQEAERIYRARYWDTLRCDELPAGVDYAVFDYGVNSGVGRAARVLQRVCAVPDDGALGPVTMQAVAACDAKSLVAAICDERLRFLQKLRTWPVFGKGWARRVAEVRATALRWTGGASAAAMPKKLASGRAVVPVAKAAQQASVTGTAAAGVAATVQAQQSGAGWGVILAVASAAAIAIVAAWLFWRWRRKHLQLS